MPTFDNPSIDAAEASEALRGLAYASRVFDQPAAMYQVIGDLSASLSHLHQVVEQVAANHESHIPCAYDDAGSHESGARYAIPVGVLDKTAESGMYTLTYNPFMGQVALYRHPNPTSEEPTSPSPEPEPPARHRRVWGASYQQPARRPGADTPRGLGL
jgi:hypothetical protein